MAKKRNNRPRQAGNACTVVCTFHGHPCSIAVYEDDKAALRAYREDIEIHKDVASKQAGNALEAHEEYQEKSRVKTSCSGLPRCEFSDGYAVAVVRGPMFTTMKATMPFIAVNYDDGRLNVVGFEDTAKAYEIYDRIRKSHDDREVQEMHEDSYKAFSTDEISVAVGIADVVARGDECQLV